MYEIFEKLLNEMGITAYRFCKDTGVSSSTISTWKKKNSICGTELAGIIANYFGVSIDFVLTGKRGPKAKQINDKDERDIEKDMEQLRSKLLSGEDGPLSYDGEPISDEDTELLLGQIELMMRRLKPINKEKYNPNKYKK